MKKSQIEILFFDVDGTLVPFGHTGPTQKTFEALSRAKDAGLKIIIATGRPRLTCTAVDSLQQAGLVDGYVTINGGICLVEDKVVYDRPMPQDMVRKMFGYCRDHNVPIVAVGAEKNEVCGADNRFYNIFYGFIKVSPRLDEISYEEAMERTLYQATPFVTRDEERIFLNEIHADDSLRSARWHPAFTDICMADKGEGIDAICRHFNIPISATAAFGDGGNDIPMLRHAALSVAMGQAKDEIKAVADWIAPTCEEEGVSWAVNKILDDIS